MLLWLGFPSFWLLGEQLGLGQFVLIGDWQSQDGPVCLFCTLPHTPTPRPLFWSCLRERSQGSKWHSFIFPLCRAYEKEKLAHPSHNPFLPWPTLQKGTCRVWLHGLVPCAIKKKIFTGHSIFLLPFIISVRLFVNHGLLLLPNLPNGWKDDAAVVHRMKSYAQSVWNNMVLQLPVKLQGKCEQLSWLCNRQELIWCLVKRVFCYLFFFSWFCIIFAR